MIFYTKPRINQNIYIFLNKRCKDGKKIIVIYASYKVCYNITLKKMMNANLFKPKIMKLTYTTKSAFNINGTTIYLTFIIPL
jgi:hypothetical protein